jgi:hypothetical protein
MRDPDDLVAVDRIRSESDGKTYLLALVKTWGRDEKKVPQLAQFEDRLACAQYKAVRDPQKRVPEFLVAKTFNTLAGQWGAPASSHVTVEDLRFTNIRQH